MSMYGFYDKFLRPEPIIIKHLKSSLGSEYKVGTTHNEQKGKYSVVVRSNGYILEGRIRSYSISCVLYTDDNSISYEQSVTLAEAIEKELVKMSQNGQNTFRGLSDLNTLDFISPIGQIGQNITFNLLVGASGTEKLGE